MSEITSTNKEFGGERSFFLIIQGDSMIGKGPNTFRPGRQILVDPDQVADCKIGSKVIAKLADGTHIFRMLDEDSEKPVLRPLNPAYPVISEPFEIIAKVIRLYISEDEIWGPQPSDYGWWQEEHAPPQAEAA